MRIGCVGGGPAGLYFSILMKLRDPGHEITVIERDPAGLTYGWGVTLWDDLLEKLHDGDPESACQIAERCFRWQDQVVQVQGKGTVHLGGAAGFAISRQGLLDILAKRAIELGVQVQFERGLEHPRQLADRDLIVACDGVNSRLRRLHADRFGTSVGVGRNKYVWLGTGRVFGTFTYAFVETHAGWIWFYAYGFDDDASTCIVECSPETWAGLGLDELSTNESIALLEQTFERYLDGHPLKVQARDPAGTPWLNFRTVTNRKWGHDKMVLMGDAAHTTHFSIGSGTRLAIEDAIGLAARLHAHSDARSALDAYTKERQAALVAPRRKARHSARWFESIHRYIELEAPQFAVLLARRDRFSWPLAKLPPRGHWWLYRVAKTIPFLRRLRAGVGSRPRGVQRSAR
jgi:2-polyprenyl-6-methoxyphenol hydroxylase-like FAD-dependent oxidoreductase